MSQTFQHPKPAGAQKVNVQCRKVLFAEFLCLLLQKQEEMYAGNGSSDGRKGFMVSQLVQMSGTPEGWVLSPLLP